MISIVEFLAKKHQNSNIEFVDLDLPSGTLWASCNVGAKSIEDIGLYFLWGNVNGHEHIDTNIVHGEYSTTSGKEYKEGETLDKKDDPATKYMGDNWLTPSLDLIKELLKHTNLENAKINNVKGKKFISKKDDSKWIFIPYDKEDFDNSLHISIWSSTYSTYSGGSPYYLFVKEQIYKNTYNAKCKAMMSIRAVYKK